MLWYEILALDYLRSELRERLADVVDEAMDQLINSGVFSAQDGEHVKITTGSSVPATERADELLRYLINVDRKVEDGVFKTFCRILRDHFAMVDLGNRLELAAQECEKQKTIGDERNCGIVRSMESIAQTVERLVSENIMQMDRQSLVRASGNRPLADLLVALMKYLSGVNRHLCNTVQEEHDLSCLTPDVRECFVPLQAVSERDAQRMTFQHNRRDGQQQKSRGAGHRRGRGDSAIEGREFVLKDAVQLLTGVDAKLNRAERSHVACADGNTQAAVAAAASCIEMETSCIVIGGAGQGKTTVCKRVIADVMHTTSGPLTQFKYVFYIPCRNVDRVQTSDWSELLGLDADALHLSGEEKQAVMQHLQDHSEEVLVLLDGIDEAGNEGLRQQSAAHALLERWRDGRSRSLLMNTTVVTTSRPCHGAYDLVPVCTLRYRLRGFTESQLSSFCLQHLGGEEGRLCIEELSKPTNHLLKEAIRGTPLLCALLCQQYGYTRRIPTSITLFYNTFTRSMVAKLEGRQGAKFGNVRLARDVTSHLCGGRQFKKHELITIDTAIRYLLEDAISMEEDTESGCDPDAVNVIRALRNLYTLCLSGMHRGEATFLQTETSELERPYLCKQDLSICQRLGLIVVQAGHGHLPGIPRFSLTHLTVQEWCASRAVVSSTDCVAAVRESASAVGIDESRHVFWRFVFGELDPKHVCCALQAIQSIAASTGDPVSKKTTLFMMRALLENQLSLQTDVTVPGDNATHTGAVGLATYKAAAIQLSAGGGIDVSALQLDIADVMAIRNVLLLADSVQLLSAYDCNLSEEHITLLSAALHKAIKVDLGGSRLSGASLEIMSTVLSTVTQSHLKELRLEGVPLTHGEQDYKSIARCMQLPGLAEFSFGGQPDSSMALSNDGLASLADMMPPSQPSLVALNFGYCELTTGCGSHLALLVSKLPCLEHLWLDGNPLSHDDVVRILDALRSKVSLKWLSLNNNELDDALATQITEFTQARHGPDCMISLRGTKITANLLEEVTRSGHCEHTQIDIGTHYTRGLSVLARSVEGLLPIYGGDLHSKLNDGMMPTLAQKLAQNDTLLYVDLAWCRITDDGATALATCGLSSNTSLRFLNFSRNKLRASGAAVILEAVASRHSAILGVGFEGNPVFEGIDRHDEQYQRLLKSLKACKKLLFVSFAQTGMSDEMGIDIAHCVAQLPGIVGLGLAHNNISDGTARAFAEAGTADSSSSLQRLQFVQNKISDDGIRYFLQSPSIMAMERIDLRGNPCSVSLFQPPLFNTDAWYTVKGMLAMIPDYQSEPLPPVV